MEHEESPSPIRSYIKQQDWDGKERRENNSTLIQDIYTRLNRQDDLLLDFHNQLIVHLAQAEETKVLINELLDLYKGSKFMVTVFKFFVPIVAAIAGAILWIKEHVK